MEDRDILFLGKKNIPLGKLLNSRNNIMIALTAKSKFFIRVMYLTINSFFYLYTKTILLSIYFYHFFYSKMYLRLIWGTFFISFPLPDQDI